MSAIIKPSQEVTIGGVAVGWIDRDEDGFARFRSHKAVLNAADLEDIAAAVSEENNRVAARAVAASKKARCHVLLLNGRPISICPTKDVPDWVPLSCDVKVVTMEEVE